MCVMPYVQNNTKGNCMFVGYYTLLFILYKIFHISSNNIFLHINKHFRFKKFLNYDYNYNQNVYQICTYKNIGPC